MNVGFPVTYLRRKKVWDQFGAAGVGSDGFLSTMQRRSAAFAIGEWTTNSRKKQAV